MRLSFYHLFSVEHSKVMAAGFYRNSIVHMWPVDSINHKPSNMYFSWQKVNFKTYPYCTLDLI